MRRAALFIALAFVLPPSAVAEPAWSPDEGVATAVPDEFGYWPVALGMTAGGDAIVAWRERDGRLLAAVKPHGQPLEAPRQLSSPGTQGSPPWLFTDRHGGAVIAWSPIENFRAAALEYVDRSPDGTLGPVQRVAAPGDTRLASLVTNSNGDMAG